MSDRDSGAVKFTINEIEHLIEICDRRCAQLRKNNCAADNSEYVTALRLSDILQSYIDNGGA